MRHDIVNPVELFKNKFKDIDAFYLSWYSWPELFSSTAGPKRGVVAGQAFTEHQVYGFHYQKEKEIFVKYCNGVWVEWDGELRASSWGEEIL